MVVMKEANLKNLLSVNSISVARSGCWVIRNLSFSISGCSALVVRGENGAGKTTLLRSLSGFIDLSDGEILLNNQKVYSRDLNLITHFVGERSGAKSHLTVWQDLNYWATLNFINFSNLADKINASLDCFNLTELKNTTQSVLSQGQKKRVALARLHLLSRPIWLLDEPYNGLDNCSILKLDNLIADHLSANGILICATHGEIKFNHKELIL